MKILVKSVNVIHPASKHHQKKVDLLLENGKIKQIATTISSEADREISIDNLHVSIGWFDSSVSFGEPGYEERETLANGLKTASKSGFTSIAVNPNTYPVTDTNSAVNYLINKAYNTGVNLYPIGALTKQSKGIDLAELYDMTNAGAIAFGDYKVPVENPNLLKIALQYVQNFGGLVQSFPQENAIARNGSVHEDHTSTRLGLKGIPALAEELQIARDLYILEYTGGKLHIPTISTASSVRLIKEAKKKGLDVSCSVAIHNLFFTDEALQEFDSNFKVMPPLRSKSDQKALLKGLKEGTIDMVTSDHCPIDIDHKNVEFEHAAYGTIGLESAFGALNTVLGLEKTIELLTSGRERFAIAQPNFEEGVIAELSFFDPEETYTFSHAAIHSSSKNSIFSGASLKGKAKGTYNHKKLQLA